MDLKKWVTILINLNRLCLMMVHLLMLKYVKNIELKYPVLTEGEDVISA